MTLKGEQLAVVVKQMEINTQEHKEIKDTLARIEGKLDNKADKCDLDKKADQKEVDEIKKEVKNKPIVVGIITGIIAMIFGFLITYFFNTVK